MAFWRLAAGLLAVAVLAVATPAVRAADAVVFAAASLKTALDAVVADWSRESGETVAISYAGSSTLAKQIEQGAPADLFFSADLDWMDYLGERSLIDVGSRSSLLGNALVLVGPAGAEALDIAPGMDLQGALGGGRLAMASVDSVPAGKYGKAALTSLGLWDKIAGEVAQTDNVRSALQLVALGEAPLGVVYATDARAEPKVAVVGTFPADSHPAIIYPVALTAESRNEAARSLLGYLHGPEAREIFEGQGFTVMN
jgi:molybdate transport system substrate-binding protein